MPPLTSSPLSTLKSRLKEAGNVLFIILIAVALFAALGYAVTQSTRSGGGDVSKEDAILKTSQIAQFNAQVDTAIQRMRVSNNCTDTQISFENPIFPGYYTNPNAPADYRCHVFRPEGGGVIFPARIQDQYLTTSGWLVNSITQDWYDIYRGYPVFIAFDAMGIINTNNLDLVIIWPFLNKAICDTFRSKLGQTGSIPQTQQTFYSQPFTGTYTNLEPTLGTAIETSGCRIKGSDQIYMIYHVLIPR